MCFFVLLIVPNLDTALAMLENSISLSGMFVNV